MSFDPPKAVLQHIHTELGAQEDPPRLLGLDIIQPQEEDHFAEEPNHFTVGARMASQSCGKFYHEVELLSDGHEVFFHSAFVGWLLLEPPESDTGTFVGSDERGLSFEVIDHSLRNAGKKLQA